MLFNSFEFLIFFIIICLLYYILPKRFNVILLLISSYYFYYSFNGTYLILLVYATLITYYFANRINLSKDKIRRRILLILSLVLSFLPLIYYKYINFLFESFIAINNLVGGNVGYSFIEVFLPVGISFYTFQTTGYLIDVFDKKIKPEKSIFNYALYVSFFPQLVAGPIERAKNLLPQFKKKNDFKYSNLVEGLKLIVWGFFLKVVVADRLAIVVDIVYSNPQNFTGFELLIATYFFAFQIFGDFAGYSFIAIGVAKILGYTLMVNFRRPYLSKSPNEFWSRWHISLSSWFRDYVYIPLGGNRVSKLRLFVNLMIVFTVSGLWHGANWTFVFWGFLNGVYVVLGALFIKTSLFKSLQKNMHQKLLSFLAILLTFHLITFSWIFFRANNFSDAFYIITNMFPLNGFSLSLGIHSWIPLMGILFIVVLEILNYLQEKEILDKLFKKYTLLEQLYYIGLIYLIIIFGVFSSNQFIYFQF